MEIRHRLIKKRLTKFSKRVRRDTALAIAGAFALVIALTWNEAIKAIVGDFLKYFNITGNTFYYSILAAVITTAICVVGIMYFSRWGEEEK